MTIIQLIILALVQGITEFLPISSSGHLILVPALTGWADQGALMDVSVHIGTLTAVLLYFKQDTKGLFLAGMGSLGITPARRAVENTLYMKLFWGLVIGTIPMVIVGGIMVATNINDMLRTAEVIAFTSIFFGILLYIADKKGMTEKTMERMAIKPALLIGVAQIFALIPGTSRAGVTMTMARYLGFTRTEAARFTMLLSIPAIIASGAATALDAFEETTTSQWVDAGIAATLSCVTALAAIHFLMKWLERANMTIFVIYRILLGMILFGLIGAGYI